jgi:hypothetical protein
MIRKDTVMPDDTVTTSSKRVTDTSVTTRREKSHPDALGLGTAIATCPTDHKAEAICQAARLATWEGEGGTTVFAE